MEKTHGLFYLLVENSKLMFIQKVTQELPPTL